MPKTQGYIKPIFSTTLRIWRKERDQIELAWDGQDILLYRNGKYLRKITETPTIQIEVWDSTETYIAGDNFVSYKSPDYAVLPESDPFSEEYIYRCIQNTNAGESPETYPEKWSRQGKVGTVGDNTIFLSDVSGLEEALDLCIKYDDLSEDFTVDSSNKVSLNIDYITLSDYSPAEAIQPDLEEVQIGTTIWKTSNESWDDGGSGIYYPDGDSNNEAIYGLLYDFNALQRLLADNPGYRLPTSADFLDLANTVGGNYQYVEGDNIFVYDPPMWGEGNTGRVPSTDLGIIAAGGYRAYYDNYQYFNTRGYYWNADSIAYYDSGNPISTEAYIRAIFSTISDSLRWEYYSLGNYNSATALSVRLVKDI